MKKKQFNVAIVGTGNMAEEYIKVLNSNKNFNIIGIVGRRINKKKYFSDKFEISNFFLNTNNLIKFQKPDLIIIATSILSTFEIIKQIKNHNIYTLIEKPIGYNYTQAKEINKILHNRKNFFVAFNRRYYSNFIYVRKQIKNDKEIFINVIDTENNYDLNKKKYPKKIRDNWMFANSIHLIDLIDYLLNDRVAKIKLIYKNDLSRSVYLQTKSGKECIYTSIWNKPGPWSIQISSKKSFYNFNNLENLEIKQGNKLINKKLKNQDKKHKPGLSLMVNDLYKLLINKKNNLKDINHSLNIMKLVNKIYDL